MTITHEARKDAHQLSLTFKANENTKVLTAVRVNMPFGLTAEEVAEVAKLPLNHARRCLTDLTDYGVLEVIGRKPNRAGKVKVSIWSVKATS